MNLPAHSPRTPPPPSSLDGVSAHFTDAKRESTSRVVIDAERSNINYSFKMNEILRPLRPSDAHLPHEYNVAELPYSSAWLSYSAILDARLASWTHRLHSAGLPYNMLKHEESSVSALSAKVLYSIGRPYDIYEVVQSKLRESPRYYPSTESASLEDLMDTLQMMDFNESVARLAYLCSTEDMEDGDVPLSLESVRGFVKFICDFQDLGREPLLGLAPSGDLSVEWRIADNKHLGVWPLDSGHVHFAFIGPSGKLGERAHLSGEGTIAKVISILREHGVDQWAKT